MVVTEVVVAAGTLVDETTVGNGFADRRAATPPLQPLATSAPSKITATARVAIGHAMRSASWPNETERRRADTHEPTPVSIAHGS